MNTSLIGNRNEQLRQVFLELSSDEHKEILYVGAKIGSRPRKQFEWQMKTMSKKGFVTILEIWENNCFELVDHEWYGKFYHDIKQGDVRGRKWFDDSVYDFSVWWHGPEHVTLKELPQTLKNLELVTTKAVILACPWGIYEQGPIHGNEWEKHQQPMYPEMFVDLGYQTWTFGEVDVKGSNLIARKEMR